MGNNNGINSQIFTSMQTHYSSLLKNGATSFGTDPMSTSIFNQIDRDKNGTLTQNEIDAAMPSMGEIIKDAAAGAKDFALKLFGGKSETNQATQVPDNNPTENAQEPNGKIDKDFKQGEAGDCWLLASIISLAETPEGQKKLNSIIQHDGNGNVLVELNGQTYKVDKTALETIDTYAEGDLDVKAIEIAMGWDRLRTGSTNENTDYPIDGGTTYEALELMFGRTAGTTIIDDALVNRIRQGNDFVVVGTGSKQPEQTALDENGNSVNLFGQHAYSVIKADENYVYLKNPHDSSHTLKMTPDDFKAAFVSAGIREKWMLEDGIEMPLNAVIEPIVLNYPE